MKAHVLLAVTLIGIGSSAAAQRPAKLKLGGGVSFPNGSFSDAVSPGWHALVGLEFSDLMQPLGLRLDGQYNHFTARSTGPDESMASATANLDYRLPMTDSPIAPYVIAGAGAYHRECLKVTCASKTKFGWNAGLGTKAVLLGQKWFADGRFHSVNGGVVGNARFVALTLGLTL
jgi:hypothetical protein